MRKMPSTTIPKELYYAKSLDELKKKSDFSKIASELKKRNLQGYENFPYLDLLT